MRLFTYQEPDQCLACGRVDLTKSEYYNTVAGIPAAYAQLSKELGADDQLIWCYVRDPGYKPSDTRLRWTLEVPDDKILCVTDDYIWNRILDIEIRQPEKLRYQWERDRPADADYVEYHARRSKEHHAFPPSGGSWWPQLFMPLADVRVDDADQLASVIIPHPIQPSWIVRRPRGGCLACNPPVVES